MDQFYEFIMISGGGKSHRQPLVIHTQCDGTILLKTMVTPSRAGLDAVSIFLNAEQTRQFRSTLSRTGGGNLDFTLTEWGGGRLKAEWLSEVAKPDRLHVIIANHVGSAMWSFTVAAITDAFRHLGENFLFDWRKPQEP